MISKYKDILKATSANFHFEGYLQFERGNHFGTIDIASAVKCIKKYNIQ